MKNNGRSLSVEGAIPAKRKIACFSGAQSKMQDHSTCYEGLTSSLADKDQLNHWEVTGSSPGPSIISGFLSKLFIKRARFDTKTP